MSDGDVHATFTITAATTYVNGAGDLAACPPVTATASYEAAPRANTANNPAAEPSTTPEEAA